MSTFVNTDSDTEGGKANSWYWKVFEAHTWVSNMSIVRNLVGIQKVYYTENPRPRPYLPPKSAADKDLQFIIHVLL